MNIEREMTESEARLHAVVESLQEGVVTADPRGRALDWNAAALALHGYTTLEEARKSLPEYQETFELFTLKCEILPVSEWPMARALRGEKFSAWELKVVRKDTGVEKVFSYNGTPVFDKDQLLFVVITFKDITERKKAEEALRQSESELRDFVENALVGLHWVNGEGIILWANKTELDLLGYSREEYVGRHITEFHADPPVINEILSSLTDGQTLINQPARLRCKDGSIRHVLINSNVYFQDGEFIHTRCFTRDISERVQAEEALKEVADRFSALADNIDQLAWMADAEGNIYWYNKRWYDYTGITLSQMQGWDWQSIHDPEVLPEVLKRWSNSIATGEAFDMEFPLRGVDGKYRPFLTRVRPLKDVNGKIVRWFGTNTDVSEQKQAQTKLQAISDNLDQLVQKRTEELLLVNDQLEGFTYSVAHDFRQQIRNININASIVLEDAAEQLNEASRRHLHRIAHAARQMNALTNDLLQYARLGKGFLREIDFNISAVAEDIALQLQDKSYCSPEARFEIQPDLRCMGDPALLRLLLENLLDNACKYAKNSSPPIIEFGKDRQGFFVRDNGVGFDMQFVHKLFQPFERLHTGEVFNGTGIGLANVKRIIDRHEGKIWAEGDLGKGATFHFVLHADPERPDIVMM